MAVKKGKGYLEIRREDDKHRMDVVPDVRPTASRGGECVSM